MSEHDSSWAAGAADGRTTGQSPQTSQESRDGESGDEGGVGEPTTSAVPGGGGAPATPAAAGAESATRAEPAGAGTTVPVPATPGDHPSEPRSPYQGPQQTHPTTAFAAGPYQQGPGYQGPGHPGAGYQPPGYQGPGQQATGYQAPGYQAPGYQAPGYEQPGSPAAGYAGTPYGADPGPGGEPAADGRPSRTRFAKGTVFVATGLAIALFSGAIGGLAAHQYDKSQPTITITRKAAPIVQPGSVASVAAAVQPAVVDITTAEGEGSGVVISGDGAILTNNHVLAGAQNNTVKVTFNDGKSADATIVGVDEAGDLGVIKAQGVSGLTVAKFANSDDVQVGDTVLALGSPLGLQGSVTAGIISATGRTIDEGSEGGGQGIPGLGQQSSPRRSIGEALQTDAAINPGNSGGALVNLAGEVVGINTAIATSGQGSSGNIGVGFAISSNVAQSTAKTLLSGGKISHPYIGVSVSDGNGGALIAAVTPGGPADKAGLQKGDLVSKVGSTVIKSSSELVGAVHAGKVGQPLALTVSRNGVQQNITVTLGQQP